MATDAEEIRIQTNPCPFPDNSLSTLSIKITRKNQDKHWKLRFIYLQCYFLTIATILGTGILGLPVTIAHAGLLPFLVSFLIGFFVQALLIYLFVELLQKCQVVQLDSLKTGVAECIVMDQVGMEDPFPSEEEDEDAADNAEADTGLLQSDAVNLQSQAESLQPNLHLLGHLFLSRPMSHAFNCILLFQFVSIGISYVLAGSEAYAALFHVSHIYVIPAFTWILTLAILLADRIIQPITSVLTLLKGIMLVVTVAVTFAVGSEVGLQSSNDFSQMGKPFLMGTVALDLVVSESSSWRPDNLHRAQHPLVSTLISHYPALQKGSRLCGCSAFGGPFTVNPSEAYRCLTLGFKECPSVEEISVDIIYWSTGCVKVLGSAGNCPSDVLTREADGRRHDTAARLQQPVCSSFLKLTSAALQHLTRGVKVFGEQKRAGKVWELQKYNIFSSPVTESCCVGLSEKAGEIATIPLTRIINERYRAYNWVAELIQVFIAISVTVSFLVMGSAMKHTIDGLVSSLCSSRLEWLSKAWERNLPNKRHVCSAGSVAKGFMSLLGFSVIFIVSVCDPRGFVVMLDKVVSFSLNTEVGLFVFIMLRESREDRFQHLSVPLPVGDCVFSLTWLLPTYFLFAVTYDVLQTLADVAHYLPLYSNSQGPYNHSYSPTGDVKAHTPITFRDAQAHLLGTSTTTSSNSKSAESAAAEEITRISNQTKQHQGFSYRLPSIFHTITTFTQLNHHQDFWTLYLTSGFSSTPAAYSFQTPQSSFTTQYTVLSLL
ncbi:hypothetical protein PAMA_001856 [Pampus argenteus]